MPVPVFNRAQAIIGRHQPTSSQDKAARNPQEATRLHWRNVKYANLPRAQGEASRAPEGSTPNHGKSVARKPATPGKVSFLDRILGVPVKSVSRGSVQSKSVQTPTKDAVAGKQKSDKIRAPTQATPRKSGNAPVEANQNSVRQIAGREDPKLVMAKPNLYESVAGSSNQVSTKTGTNTVKELQADAGKGSSVPENTPVNLRHHTSRNTLGAVGEKAPKKEGNNVVSPKDAARNRWSKVWLYDLPRAEKDTK